MPDFQIDVIRDKGTNDEFASCPRVCEFPDFLAQRADIGPAYPDYLIDPDEVVTTESKINIKFEYPLTNPTTISFANPDGFTKFGFFACVYKGYKSIYDEEESTDEDPGMIPGMMNRATSNGPYGIWGHVMGDLFLEGVEDKGDGNYELIIGS